MAVEYVSKCIKVIPTKTNDARIVKRFVKSNIFSRFGVPKVLISDGGVTFIISS